MSNVVVIAKLTVKDGTRDQAVTAFAPMMDHVESEDGTVTYNLITDNADPNTIWFYEEYTDEAALAAHGTSTAMKTIGRAIGEFMAGPPDVRVCTFVRGKGR